MTSILTNTAAMTALANLTATQRELTKTQAQVSSGLAVGTASDNAAYWSIGQTMRAQVAGLAAVQQSLSLTDSIADVTSAALTSIKDSLQRIEADVVTASEAGTDETQVQSDITAQQQSIIAVANSASFNGINWLVNHTLTSSSTDNVYNIDVSKDEYASILQGKDPGAVAHFDATKTVVDAATQDGVEYSETTVSGSTITVSDAQDGTMSKSSVAKTTVTTGDDTLSSLSDVEIPTSMSSDGTLLKNSFSLAPLTLFSSNVATQSNSLEVYYNGVEDSSASYSSSSNLGASESYQGDSASSSGGILDGTFEVTARKYVSYPATPAYTYTDTSLDDSGGSSTTITVPASSGYTGYETVTAAKSVLDFSVIGVSSSQLSNIEEALQTATTRIINASALVGGLQNQISTEQTFNSSLSDSLTSGIGSLVDADMNVASARLQAEQTQQQLGIQALSVANQNGQLILKLFQAA